MKNIKLKKMTPEEFKTKKIMIEASGFFDENTMKMLEIAVQRNMDVVFNEKQVELLEMMRLTVEVKSQGQAIQGTSLMQKTSREKEEIPFEGKREFVESIDVSEDVNPELSEDVVEEPMLVSEEQTEEIDAQIEVNSEEKVEEKEETERQKFIPESPEELENMPPEEVEKMYYLTGERMIETLMRMNNGNTWKALGLAGNDNELQKAIEKAYRSVVYPSDLTSLEFLDKRVGEYLPEGNQAIQLKDLHKAALLGTYVGYHVEQNNTSINEIDNTKNTAIIEFPLLANELPDSLKSQTKSDLKKAISRSVEDIMNMSDSYKALMILIPIERTIDEAMQDYSEGLHDTEENKAVKAYIKTIRADMNNEIKNGMEDLNVSLDLYGIDWEDKDTRKSVIAMIHTLQGEGREAEVEKLVEEINMSFDVNSPSDVEAVDNACRDLSKLSSQGIKVNIAFEMPPQEAMNPELQVALNEVVDKYENIERDTSQELVDNGVDVLLSAGIESALSQAAVGQALDMATPEDVAKNTLMSISLSASAFGEIGQEIEEFLERQRNLPNESEGE